MSTQPITPPSEATLWARLIDSQPTALSPAAAAYLLNLKFSAEDQSRVQQLADQSETGTLTDTEAREFDSYLHIANLLAVIQSKARLALIRDTASPHHS